MKKNSLFGFLVFASITVFLFFNSSVLFAQTDILDLCPSDQAQEECTPSPDVTIPVNLDGTSPDTIVIINNYSVFRYLETGVPNVQYKFCGPNNNVDPGSNCTHGPGEFHILFKFNGDTIGVNKVSFQITHSTITVDQTTITVTSYQGESGTVSIGTGITGGREYTFVDNTTKFDSITIVAASNGSITSSSLFILDNLFLPSEAANIPPTDITLSSNTINENASVGTDIGSFANNDPDTGDTFTYSLVDETTYPDNTCFQITGNILESKVSFNYEDRSSYSIRVQVDDGHSNTYSKEFVINVNDVTEVVNFSIDNITSTSFAENSAYSSPAPHFTLTPIGSVEFEISGTDADDFSLDQGTGVVSMIPRNFESPVDDGSNNTYTVTLTVTDEDNNTTNKTWTVTITDIKEDADFNIEGISNVSIEENTLYNVTPSISGAPIGKISWSLSGDDADEFNLDPLTGQVTANSKNFESPQDNGSNNVYDLTLTAEDEDDNSDVISWTVAITDKQETANLSIQTVENAEVGENSTYNSGYLSLTGDPPIGAVTWTIEAGSDNEFSISSSTGNVTMSGQNFENPEDEGENNIYFVSVKATDSDNNSNTIAWTVTVTDVIEASNFAIAEIPDVEINENEEYNFTVTISPSNPPPIGNVTYSLEGVDGGRFSIVQSTGEVEMVARDFEYPEDYDNNSTYLVTVTAADEDGNVDSEEWVVTVKNVIVENPPTVVCLLDLSFSMNMGFNNTSVSNPNAVKLYLAKSALIAFIDLLHEFNPGKSSLGLVRFPNSPQVGCDAGSIKLIRALTEEFRNELDTEIPFLSAPGNSTPLLAGIDFARNMFNTTDNKVLVLLSDGCHNCPPEIIITDEITTTYSDALKNAGITLYTIGFGLNSIVPNNMLSKMATGTIGGMHYNIEAFSSKLSDPYNASQPDTWDAGTALHAAYANIIVNGLGLESSSDPLDIINQGEVKQFHIPTTVFDNKVCFFVSWITPQENYLGVKLYSPAGNEISLEQNGVNKIHRSNHTIITLSGTILDQPGMTGTWCLKIDGSGINNSSEHFQYTVINSSKKLDLRTWFEKSRYFTGDKIKIFLEVLLDEKPFKGLDKIYAMGTRPAMSPGNWLVSKKIDDKMLEKARQKQLEEYLKWLASQPNLINMNREAQEKYYNEQQRLFLKYLNPVELRVQALQDEYQLPLPERVAIGELNFSDDGNNGDKKAGDGIYTAVYIPKREGSYSFNISCSDSSRGEKILRESHLQTYVGTRIVIIPSFKNIRVIGQYLKGEKTFELTFKLKDKYGNIPLPSELGDVKIEIEKGKLIDRIIDNMNGTFTQKISLPENIKPKEVTMTLSYNGMSGSRRISKDRSLLYIVLGSLIVITGAALMMRKKKKTTP